MGYQYWKYDQLDALCNDAFQKFGFNAEEAKIVSDVLLMSDRIGIESHGMQRMYRYYKSIQKGMIKVESKGKVLYETPVSAVLDAEDGMGQVVGHKAMAMAIPIKMFEVDQCTFFHHLGLMKDESIVSVRAEAVIIHQKGT
jgi:LDH2 family malate/lactate/ureidoglycolate dehydrogenase